MSKRKKTSSTKPPLTIHLMGNAHLDPAWMWRWTEGYAETISLAHTVLASMDELEQFKFVRSSAQSYQWVLEHDPELFEQIKARVAEGRWDIVGGWWEQPDLNVTSAESLIRQGVLGQRFFLEHFGRAADVGYCVDSFGHPAGLPTLLQAVGLKAYVFMRPSHKVRPELKSLFRWIGPDGSEVIGIHIPNYGVWTKDKCPTLAEVIRLRPKGVTDLPYMYGFGDHGGGPSREDVRQLTAIAAGDDEAAMANGAEAETLAELKKLMRRENVKQLTFSSYTELMKKIDTPAAKAKLSRHQGHAHWHSQGSYTSISAIKRNIRQLENELFSAESALATAKTIGLDVPDISDDLRLGWESLLFNQFHDLGAGTCYFPATDDCVRHLEAGRYHASVATNAAMQKLFRAVDVSKFYVASFLYNPLPWPVTASVTVSGSPCLFDESGRPMPFQPVSSGPYRGGHELQAGTTVTLPACGGALLYNDGKIRPPAPAAEGAFDAKGPVADELKGIFEEVDPAKLDSTVAEQVRAGQAVRPPKLTGRGKTCRAENESLSMRLDARGRLRQITLKDADVDLLAGPIQPVVVNDEGDAWGMAPDHHTPLHWDEPLEPVETEGRAEWIDLGQMRGTVATNYRWRNSRIRIEWTLARGLGYIDGRIEIHWQDRHAMLKLAVPTALGNPVATLDTPACPLEVPVDGVEQPCQKWIDLTGRVGRKTFGLALANDAKYACSMVGATMNLTLLRSAHMAYMSMGRGTPPPRAHRYYMDQGLQEFRVRLIPHVGDWRAGQVQRRATELNCPPIVVRGGMHDGALLADFSAIEVGPDNVLPMAVKPADDGKGLIVRLWESAGRAVSAAVRVGEDTARVRLGKHQIKTVRLTGQGKQFRAVEVDALERAI